MIDGTADGVVLHVRVIPRAGRAGLDGTRDGALVVRLKSAPVDGAANAELVAVVADAFGVPKRAVTILSGERARGKRVRIAGISAAAAQEVVARGVPRR